MTVPDSTSPTSPPRIGGSVFALDPGFRLLLVETFNGSTRCELPGGTVRPGETARAATIRAAHGQLGIPVRPGYVLAAHHTPATELAPASERMVFFCGTFHPDTAFSVGDEVKDVHWIDRDAVPGHVDDHTAHLIDTAFNAVGGAPVHYLDGALR